MELPSQIRRRHRINLAALASTAIIFSMIALFMCWVAAGMMIDSDKMCWAMDSCRQGRLAHYK